MFILHQAMIVFNVVFNGLARSGARGGLGNTDLSHVTSVGKVVIARAHVTVFPRLCDAKTWRVAGRWGVVQLRLQIFSGVAALVKVKI